MNKGVCASRERVNFENKYFRGAAPAVFIDKFEDVRIDAPFAVVFVNFPGILELFKEGDGRWQEAECKILLCDKADEELECICEDLEIEIVIDSIQHFTGFTRNNYEYQGIGRIKEALECAVASYLTELEEVQGDNETQPKEEEKKQESHKKEEKEEEKWKLKEETNEENSEKNTNISKNTVKEEDFENDLQNFDYFLSKIKQNCVDSKNLDDETRRKNAEKTIIELAKYLQLDDSDEDSSFTQSIDLN